MNIIGKNKIMQIDTTTEHFHIRSITAYDKEGFMKIRRETSEVASSYELFPEFLDCSWNATLNDETEISMVVFQGEELVAICCFQDYSGDSVDIGYDVDGAHRGKGIGTLLAGDLVTLAHQVFPNKKVYIRIREQNKASQRVAEKCGGKMIGYEPTPEAKLLKEMLGKFSKSSKSGDLITEEEKIAAEKIIESGVKGIRVYLMP